MLSRIFAGLMVIALCAFSVPALSADWGIGYTLQSETTKDVSLENANYFHGISGRAWFDKIGAEVNLFINQNDTDSVGFKGMYAPEMTSTENFKAYLGAAGMYYELKGDTDDDVLGYGPFVGAEYMLSDNIGVNLDATWYFVSDEDRNKTSLSVEDLSMAFGIHYYF